MTDDDALIENMAEAMWNTPPDPCRHSWKQIINLPFAEPAMTAELMRKRARVALSVVRKSDKMVQAGSTGAVCDKCGGLLSNEPPIDVYGLSVKASIKDDTGVYHSTCWPTVDRTSPPSFREPDLPTSLLAKIEHKGGVKT